jgi:hypothetical protein
MLAAVRDALEDGRVGSILIRDQLRIDETKPRPLGEILGATENVGSCEPGPLIKWDKTQQTWHTDVDGVGRYSIRKGGELSKVRGLWHAFLNGTPINGHGYSDKDLDAVKRNVENRINNARRIANDPDPHRAIAEQFKK